MFLLGLLLLILSCSSLSFALKPTPEAAVPGDAAPLWEPLSPGLEFCAGRIKSPKLAFRALRVDLTLPGIGVVVNRGDSGGEIVPEGGVMASTTVSRFVRQYACLAGINTNPFTPSSAREGERRTVVGVTIADGTLVSPPHPAYDALVFYADGAAAVVPQAAMDATGITHAVGGFFTVLRAGNVLPGRSLSSRSRHPRSAAGVSSDGRTLYLLVIDGRRIGSVGATEAETGLLLKRLGAFDGLNFDGGGSTALALRYPDGAVRTANTPIHGGIPKRERAVATCLGITRR
jgi:hypothetical protein